MAAKPRPLGDRCVRPPDGSKALADSNSLFLYYNPLRIAIVLGKNTALESSRFIENPPSVLRRDSSLWGIMFFY